MAWHCPVGGADLQLRRAPGAQTCPLPTRPSSTKEGESLSRIFSYLCSSCCPHQLFLDCHHPSPTLSMSQGPSCTGQERGE